MSSSPFRRFVVVCAVLGTMAVGYKLRHRLRLPKSRPEVLAVAVAAAPVKKAHPRLLLDEATIARLKEAKKVGTPAWKLLSDACTTLSGPTIRASYQGFDWAEAVLNLSLCWHASGDAKYADLAVKYLRALQNDKEAVGDGQGGENIVRGDSGYGIRSWAVYSALAYDWLYHAPSMTPELRRQIPERLFSWLAWYKEKGYQRDLPFSNYFWGYLTAAAFTGLATAGEHPQGDTWLNFVRNDLLGKLVLPKFRTSLKGGDYPEGWQYGELVAMEAALVVKAFMTATGTDLRSELPWLSEVVDHHVHALTPGGNVVYDGGDWGEKPATPSGLALLAISYALEGKDDKQAARARWLVRNVMPKMTREKQWLGMLAERPGAQTIDPRIGAPTSWHMPGTGLTFFRTAWNGEAVWVSFQAGPVLCTDHQHADQGHFAFWRGEDGLLIDGGGYGSGATMNHNSLLIDDGGRVLNYTPNQGMWAENVRTLGYEDDGAIGFVAGDFTESYHPNCAPDGCNKRVADRVVRKLVFVRPNVLFIDDEVALEQGQDGVMFALHTSVEPKIAAGTMSAEVGSSKVEVRTVWPEGAKISVLKEPTINQDKTWLRNHPFTKDMWRTEIATPRGSKSRRILTVVAGADKSAAFAGVTKLVGQGLRGAEIVQAGQVAQVLSAERTSGGSIDLPSKAEGARVVAIGLGPNTEYQVTSQSKGNTCRLDIKQGAAGGKRKASSGGKLSLVLKACNLQ